MRFEVVGPFFVRTPRIIKVDHIRELKASIEGDETVSGLLSAPGCYVFGVKSTGAKR
jgi:hypothetical protein